jgi:hypothetical protein
MKPESVFDPSAKPPHVLCAEAIGTAMDVLETAMSNMEDCAGDLDQDEIDRYFELSSASKRLSEMAAQLGCEHLEGAGPLLDLCDIVMDG